MAYRKIDRSVFAKTHRHSFLHVDAEFARKLLWVTVLRSMEPISPFATFAAAMTSTRIALPWLAGMSRSRSMMRTHPIVCPPCLRLRLILVAAFGYVGESVV